MDISLFYTGLISSVIITIVIAYIGIKGLKRSDIDTNKAFFLLPKALTENELIATLASTNTALALIVFWFSYLGWLYGLGAAFWLSICWIAGLEMFAYFQKNWTDFPMVEDDDKIKYQTLHDYISPEKGNWARRSLALVSIISFILMITIELTRGMKIIDVIPQDESNTIRDLIGFIIILLAGIYSAFGGFKAAVRTDYFQWFFTALALIVVAIITITGIWGKENLFGSIYFPQNFSLKSFFLIPTQPYFILGSLFSWTFWFFVTMDMWQRAASSRKIEVVSNKIRKRLYPWFVFLSLVSVSIGVYVRINLEGQFNITFPVVDFLIIAFNKIWTYDILKYVAFTIVFAGFITAMISTIDTYLVTVTQSIFRDLPDRKKLDDISSSKFSRLFVGIVIFGLSLIVFPIFLLVYHSNFSINSLLYLATSAPFILLPAILLKRFKHKSISIVTSVIFGAIGVMSLIGYVLYNISIAAPEELGKWYDYMYLIPFLTFIISCIGYLISLPFNKE